ncbi:hypothetical protein [Cyclobacterium sp.]|uniref:hypothetical protein n=1 Tax=Cyclobacterium sp. TaxID=1966343 RepID=UPI0019BBE8C1|nr:hypothetical protein [Cyclobacterium sp.]MBD3628511.1 hypothetical protein [Cyclobacterium sp.]
MLLAIGSTFQGLLYAQDYLLREIDFSGTAEGNVGSAMEEIAGRHGFYFSYQSSLVDLESKLPFSSYQGKLAGFLQGVFGDSHEFREHDAYVIIRYAPGKLDADLEMVADGKSLVIQGQIRDYHTAEPVSTASIYEKNGLAYAMSDGQGNFELRLKSASPSSVWLTLRKEEYRDTSFVLLPPVQVDLDKHAGSRFRFLPGNGSADNLEESFWGGMFIGFRQRMQRLNLAGFFAESPVQMSLIPGLSTQGVFSSQMINNFSLNLLGGYTAGVEGLEVAGLFNMNQRMVSGMQTAGLFNMVGGGVSGFQAAGIFNNVYDSLSGFQVAGILNKVGNDLNGAQVAGLVNQVAGKARIQIAGLANRSYSTDGFQLAGLINRTKAGAGKVQIAGILNQSGANVDYQVSGLFNKADTVVGLQLSLVNVAASSDYTLGLVNIVGDGEKSISVGLDESSFVQLSLRSGGRKLYGLLGTGLRLHPITLFGLDLGLGWHAIRKRSYFMDVELVNRLSSDFAGISNHSNVFRMLQGFQSGRMKYYAGPTIAFSVLDQSWAWPVGGWVIAEKRNSRGLFALHAGLTGGVQYVF